MLNVIVTGGSRGLGLGIARRLNQSGFRVIAIARKENPELLAAMAEAEAANRGSFYFVAFDLANVEGFQNLVKTIRKGGCAAVDEKLRDRAGHPAEHALADCADQVCSAIDDGGWRRADCECVVDYCFDRL